MAKYQTGNDMGGSAQNLSTSYKTIVSAIGASSSPKRNKIYDILCGQDGTPVDVSVTWDLSRMTADDGTKTNVTPSALDPADAAALTLSRANFSAEGTITSTSSVLAIPINCRTSFRWVAAPGGELVAPATASNGFALRAKSPSYASTVLAKLHFEEQ
jgi:hypothetical protein